MCFINRECVIVVKTTKCGMDARNSFGIRTHPHVKGAFSLEIYEKYIKFIIFKWQKTHRYKNDMHPQTRTK